MNRGFPRIVFILIGRMHINERCGKQNKRIENISRPFPSVHNERRLVIILTTRYCFIYFSHVSVSRRIRKRVENNREETKRPRHTQLLTCKSKANGKNVKKISGMNWMEGKSNGGCDARGRLSRILHSALSWLYSIRTHKYSPLLCLRWKITVRFKMRAISFEKRIQSFFDRHRWSLIKETVREFHKTLININIICNVHEII